MAQSKPLDKDFDTSFKCSICFLAFVLPKELPCLHVCCLKCLKKYCECRKEEDKAPCPLCRKEFSIPEGDVEQLPNHDFMGKLIEMHRSNGKTEKPSLYDPGSQKDARKTLHHSNHLTSINSIKVHDTITDLTLLNDRLFIITHNQSEVKAYDCNTGIAQSSIKITDMVNPRCIVGCSYNKVLYIGDWKPPGIHRVNGTGTTLDESKPWKLFEDFYPMGLSLTSDHNVLATLRIKEIEAESKIVEYTSEGQLIRELKLERSIENLYHTIQICEDRFVFCQGGWGSAFHRVGVINSKGQIIKSYGNKGGQGEGQLENPCDLAIDKKKGHIFVGVRANDEVLKFNQELDLLGRVGIEYPTGLCVDSDSERLFVGENTECILVFNLNDIRGTDFTLSILELA